MLTKVHPSWAAPSEQFDDFDQSWYYSNHLDCELF